jgi:UPF0755 protein
LYSKRSKFLLVFFISFSFAVILSGTAKSYSFLKPELLTKTLTVAQGDSINRILNKLSSNIFEKTLIKIFLFTNNINLIQAGHYDIESKSWQEIFFNLSNGKIKVYKFKIQEGSNFFHLKDQILSSQMTLDCPNFDCLSAHFGFIEGTLMPETYFYNFQSSASNILIRSQKSFFEYAELLWSKRISSNSLKSLKDAIILASIVEKEAGNNMEKPIIAGVFLHRLEKGMRLQADPTIIYGLLPNFNGNITKVNLRDKTNPFNTYQISGLPPSPISLISKSSLEAVILGTQNEYLYFVAKGDGTHYFSRNYKEHLNAVKIYQLNNR